MRLLMRTLKTNRTRWRHRLSSEKPERFAAWSAALRR